MDNSFRKWTFEEETRLINNVKNDMTLEEISEKLGRTKRAIEMRIEKLQIKEKMIYVLLCENEKYYIGKTERLEDRILEHFSNYGSEWTKIYKPIKVIESFQAQSEFDEDNYVEKYMAKYGIENVRGGSYSQISLPEFKIKSLIDELNTSEDRCFRCGKAGHFANNCKQFKCYGCGKPGHFIKNCPENKEIQESETLVNNITGSILQYFGSWFQSTENTQIDSYNIPYFYYRKKILNFETDLMYIFTPTQSDCSRNNHTIEKCYAKSHFDGHKI